MTFLSTLQDIAVATINISDVQTVTIKVADVDETTMEVEGNRDAMAF